MSNQQTKIFHCDFRSPPSGLGTVDNILIQDMGSCPKIRDGIYDKIIKLDYDACDSKEGFLKYIDKLVELGVTHVQNSELETDLRNKYENYCYPIEIYKQEILTWY